MKDKRIGQVTYCSNNYGSMLQCYATQKMLALHGFSCDLIEITNRPFVRIAFAGIRQLKLMGKYASNPKSMKALRRLVIDAKARGGGALTERCRKAMEQFREKNISVIRASTSQMKHASNTDQFIGFFSGSDQIWSASWPIPSELYFLRFAPKDKRIAFAPSFGTDRIPSYNKKTFRKYIADYSVLSIREESGRDVIKELTGREAEVLNDPVLQISADVWKELALRSSVAKRDTSYILLFFLNEPTVAVKEQIVSIQKATGLKCIALGYLYDFHPGDVAFLDGDPCDFVCLIRSAKLVLSDSFHALAFSLIFNVDFISFQRNYTHFADQSIRLTELLRECKLEDRFVKNGQNANISNLFGIDFSTANQKRMEIQARSEAFMEKVLHKLERQNEDM